MFRLNAGDPFSKESISEEDKQEVFGSIYIFTEGTKTEQRYFSDLATTFPSDKYNINIVDRIEEKIGVSNPRRIVKEIVETLNGSSFDDKEIEEIEEIINGVQTEKIKSGEILKLIRFIKQYYPSSSLKEDSDYIEVVNQVQVLLGLKNFESRLDKIYLVVDRDKNSFTELQYTEVIDEAKKYDLNVVITNPCIEFYFLLHLSDMMHIDDNELVDNIKERSKSLCERELIKQMKLVGKKYSKSVFDSSFFIEQFEVACENILKYTSDLEKIKTNPGSNLCEMVIAVFPDIMKEEVSTLQS